MADRIQQRRDTAARWAEYNPILLEGEIGWVTDNPNQYKIGDGVNAWNALPLRGYSGTVAQTIGTDDTAVLSQAATSKLSGLNKFLTFNPSYNYSKGEPIIYDGLLYKFTEAHPAGVWIGTDVVEASLKEVVDDDIFNIYGSQLFVDGYWISLVNGNAVQTTTTGFGATDFLPITGLEDITVICGWLNTTSNITPMAFYDEKKQFLGAYTEPSNEMTKVYTTKAADIPAGAKFVRCTSNKIRPSSYNMGKPRVIGVDFASLLSYTNAVQTNVEEQKKELMANAAFSECPEIIEDLLWNTSGGVGNWLKSLNWDTSIVKIYDDSKKLTVKGIPINSQILVIWFSDLFIDSSNQIGSVWITASSPVVYEGSVTIPANAKVAVLDIPTANNVEGYKNFRVLQEGAGATKALVQANKILATGDFFKKTSSALRESGEISGSVTGLNVTYFLPITGKNPIRLEGGWRNADSQITPIAFYDENKQFLSCYMGDRNTDSLAVYEYAVSAIPTGAKFIRACVNILSYPNYALYGVDIASLSLNTPLLDDYNFALSREGSFSGEPNVIYGYLANISAENEFAGYLQSNNYDCCWVTLYTGATQLNLIGAQGRLVAWFNDNYPSADTFISTQLYTSGVVDIPTGAKLAIIDFSKADNANGYKELRITQEGFGAFRKEDVTGMLESAGLINYEDGVALDTGETINGYMRAGGDILLTSDYVHQDVVIPNNQEKYHVVITRWPQASAGVVFMVAFDAQGRSLGGLYGNPVPGYGLDEIVKFPFNTAKVSINWRSGNAPAPKINLAIAKELNVGDIQKEVDTHDDILRKKEFINVDQVSDTAGYFITADGTPKANGSFHYTRFDIEDATLQYVASSGIGGNTQINYVYYYNESGAMIGNQYWVTTPSGGSDQLVRAKLTIPAGTVYINMNANNSNTCVLEIEKDGDYYDLSQLGKETKGLMKVHVYGMTTLNGADLFYVRTAYNKAKTKDIILVYYTNNNGLISPRSAYVGPRELEDSALMTSAYLVTTHSDSTAPLFNSSVYWHLFAQHGYPIPYIPNSNGMTADDIGAVWKDQLERQYTIGNVTSASIYLLPVITGTEGSYTRDWKTPNSTAISSLSWVSGGVTRTAITSATQSTIQLRPIMQSYNRKYVFDGVEATEEGDYWCDEYQVSESQIGYDPATIQNWFPTVGAVGVPDLTGALEMARFTWSYNFKGAQCCVNTTIDIRRKVECQSYGATQQQTFFDKGSYKAMFLIPKAAAQAGIELDKPFNSPSSSSTTRSFFRNSTFLKDTEKLIDRLVAYLHNPDTDDYLVGMAGGLSLVSGDTIEEKRKQNIAVFEGSSNAHARLGSFSPSNTNKFYIAAVNTYPFADDNYNFPNTYFKEINYYLSFFDPSENVGQVYWYKDGKDYVIYCHCQTAEDRIAIEVPEFMEGLGLDIVEQTDGAQLLSSTIQNGKFFVSYTTADANYIVLKTK